jgi:hypothetical protein
LMKGNKALEIKIERTKTLRKNDKTKSLK